MRFVGLDADVLARAKQGFGLLEMCGVQGPKKSKLQVDHLVAMEKKNG